VRIALQARIVGADACRRATDKVLDENIRTIVCVTRNEVTGMAIERHVATVAADTRSVSVRGRIALHARSVSADACRRATDKVLDENIRTIVCVTRNEVTGIAIERHIAAVAADTRAVRVIIALHPRAVGADAYRRATDKILDEDVQATVCISQHEIARLARERHITTIVADARGVERTCTSLSASSIGADACRSPTDKILDEDIPVTVGVSWHKVTGLTAERHIAAVAADTGVVRIFIPLRARIVGADACRRTTDKVLDENIRRIVCVTRNEVTGIAIERHVATIATHAWIL